MMISPPLEHLREDLGKKLDMAAKGTINPFLEFVNSLPKRQLKPRVVVYYVYGWSSEPGRVIYHDDCDGFYCPECGEEIDMLFEKTLLCK